MPVTATGQYSDDDKQRQHQHDSAQKQRSAFETDKGRIVHAAAFRRLQGKTQVLGVGERDFYRTRLTHSLEVAQLGRGLCLEIPDAPFRPDQDLVEAICLAHDIGHSPFGHFGEHILHAKINEAMGVKPRDSKAAEKPTRVYENAPHSAGFGANPQNLRIVTQLEAKVHEGGLDLTRATLDGLTKYPVEFDPDTNDSSKCFYSSDKELFEWIKRGVKDPTLVPLEGQLADWADQVTYSINDTEDVIRAGLFSFADMRSRCDEISEKSIDSFKKARKARTGSDPTNIPAMLQPEQIKDLATDLEARFIAPKQIRERKINLKKWTSDTIKELTGDCRIELLENNETSIRYRARLTVPQQAEARSILLKKMAAILVFSDPRVTTLEEKGRLVLETLFERFLENTSLLPLDFQQMIDAKTYGPAPRLVADFIAGMTDRYAYSYYSRLTQPGSGSFYELV